MPKSRQRKNHKQKSQARSIKMKEQKDKALKMQRDFIMNMIKQEQEKGLFENNPTINPVLPFGPTIDGPAIDGPFIDANVLDNKIVGQDGNVIEGPSI